MFFSSSSSRSSSPERSSESEPNRSPSSSSAMRVLFFFNFPLFLCLPDFLFDRRRVGPDEEQLLPELPLSSLFSAACSSKNCVDRNQASVTSSSVKTRPILFGFPMLPWRMPKNFSAFSASSHFNMMWRTMKSTLFRSFLEVFRMVSNENGAGAGCWAASSAAFLISLASFRAALSAALCSASASASARSAAASAASASASSAFCFASCSSIVVEIVRNASVICSSVYTGPNELG
mmetsp:Transcript_107096/g.212615  ORF Transcript_107096/g.212615 Transcript_107096/m.212615 type:complete len:235 (+) Transcript_107096:399-1103(+)